MINVLVTLEVKDFELLAVFEKQAVKIMRSYGGNLVRAFETTRNEDGSGQEVHLLEFPSDDAFAEYRSDSRLIEHAELRKKAIDSMVVVISGVLKEYT